MDEPLKSTNQLSFSIEPFKDFVFRCYSKRTIIFLTNSPSNIGLEARRHEGGRECNKTIQSFQRFSSLLVVQEESSNQGQNIHHIYDLFYCENGELLQSFSLIKSDQTRKQTLNSSLFMVWLHFNHITFQQILFLINFILNLLIRLLNLRLIQSYPYQLLKMMKIVLFAMLVCFVLAFKPCEPFGTRIFYGQVAQNKNSQEKLQIYFNTAQVCNRSYVQLIRKSGLEKVECTITSLHLSSNVKNYETYIHKCSISSINYEQVFHYNVFGWDGSSSNPIPFSTDFISVKIADITNANLKLNLVVLADWSHLEKNIGKYTPLDNLFASVLNKQQIHGLLINGDVGYDLDTNNCLNYQSFLVMLSNTAKNVPVIMVTGNHEYNTDDNYKLFQSSFQLYNLDTKLATSIELGPLYLLPFDPYVKLFGKKGTKDPAFDQFNALIKTAKLQNKFIIPTSHYPLACSGTSKNCKNDRTDLGSYWQAMFDAEVSLYLGAHYHTYQRIHPYLRNNEFRHQTSDFRANGGYIISIVQGVAGNDKDIVESIETIQDFTAAYTINETGFGVLSIDQSKASYIHYSTKRGITDEITITRQMNSGNLMRE